MGILRGTADTIEVNAKAIITEDLGKKTTLKFKVTYRRREYDDAKSAIDKMNDPDNDISDETLIREDLVKWRDLEGDGGEVEFTDENLTLMLGHPEYRLGLFRAWGDAQLRTLAANAKNS